MKLTSLILAVTLGVGGISLCGCQSSNPPSNSQNTGYAGGNGAFGESPVNPGEHSQQRFDNPPSTQPAGQ